MCAIFLLILVADVARAQALAPMVGDASGGLMLSAATHALASQGDDLERGGGKPSFTGQYKRGFGSMFLGLRAPGLEQGSKGGWPSRSILNSLAVMATAAPETNSGLEQVSLPWLETGLLRQPVSKHLGSPAP